MSKFHIASFSWICSCVGIWWSLNSALGWIFIVTLFYLALLATGSFKIGFNFYLFSLNRLPKGAQRVAITFDDGPHPNSLPLLEVLKKYGVKATFFCVGEQIERYPDILRKVHEMGHQIGNHTYSHRHTFPIFSVEKMVEEIRRTNDLIQTITGSAPQSFRPPFGVTNPRIAEAIKKTGMMSVGWNRRSFDTNSTNVVEILERTAAPLQVGDIVLFHDRLPECASILTTFLEISTAKGVTFGTVME